MFHEEVSPSEATEENAKMYFFSGVAVGILSLCTIGFFVLLAVMFASK
ncbi:MAG: hypothetical protein WC817_02920 [Patescibacteria group bacterium]